MFYFIYLLIYSVLRVCQKRGGAGAYVGGLCYFAASLLWWLTRSQIWHIRVVDDRQAVHQLDKIGGKKALVGTGGR